MTLFVKYEDLDERIAEVRYHRVEGTTSTVCTVILHSGFVVVGHSAALNSEAFVAETGTSWPIRTRCKICWPWKPTVSKKMRMTRSKRSLKWHKQNKWSW